MSFRSNKVTSTTQPLAGVQILLVEDQIDEAEIFTVLLEGVGAEVIGARYAYEALSSLSHHNPDILICDVRLPDMDGNQLIQQIRSQEVDSHLPAIATTTYTRDVSGERMLESGFDRYLLKTYNPEELITTILDLLKEPT